MKRVYCAGLGLVFACGMSTTLASAAEIRAGVAVADITPPVGWRLAGNFYDDPSKGVHDPLLAKALVFEQGGTWAALVICDLTGIPRETTAKVQTLAQEKTGIPAAHISVGATHTHGAPLFYDYRRELFHKRALAKYGKDPHEPIDYERILIDACVKALSAAKDRAVPVRLEAGVAPQPGLAFNRRFHMKDGTVRFNPGKKNPNIVRPAGPVDTDYHLLLLTDARTDKPLAALSTFAMHVAAFGGGELGADYPMHLQERLRERFGKDFLSLFGEGCAGDVNHIDVTSDRPQTSREEPARIGKVLAETFLKSLPNLRQLSEPALAVRTQTVKVPLREVTEEQVARAREQLDRTGADTPPFLVLAECHRILDVQEARRQYGADLPMDIHVFRLDNDTAIVTLPHEIFVELGLAIKRTSPFKNTFVLSLCNGIDFYVPTQKAYAEGSYEVVNSRVKLGAGELLVDAATALLKELKSTEIKSPLSPQQAREEFRLSAGLKVELVASEPQIESPVAMAFDESGRLWVVEMGDYPNGPARGEKPRGRIKILEDRDGDGFFETATVFADGLLFANGLMPWKGGVVVTAAPHILYLKANSREVLYEGFTAGNPQLRVSHPILGLDGWVYVANGLRGGSVVRHGREDPKPISLGGMDFRFDLLGDRAEAISGMGQYGNTFDDWGNRFVCDNRNHLRHFVLEARYLRRNPYLAAPAVVEDTSELPSTNVAFGGAKVYPISHGWTTSNLHAGHFTAACGVFVYRGELLPAEFRGCAFTCEPTGNLIHQEQFLPNGATFRSRPPHEGIEFLATPDEWFRPVSLAHGPDGALYVVDMYRAVIEHPEFMPSELKNRPDLVLGRDKGRIWRIVPEGQRSRPQRPDLGKASVAELVKHLEHTEAWWRITAQRLLLERGDKAAIEPLRRLCAESRLPQARLHAAWLLHSQAALDDNTLGKLLADEHPRLRENAVRLAEGRLADSSEIRTLVLGLAKDADARVRFQVALSLGEWDDPAIVKPLADIALAGADDRFTRTAVLSSVPKRSVELLAVLARANDAAAKSPGRVALLHELAAVIGARNDAKAVAAALEAAPTATVVAGLAEGLARRGARLGTILAALPAEGRRMAAELLGRAARIAEDAKASPADRVEAVRLLAHGAEADTLALLARLLAEESVPEVRLAAARSIAALPSSAAAEVLLRPWKSYTPALRQEVTEALLRSHNRIAALLAEVEAGHIAPRDLDPASVRRLVGRNDALGERARKTLAAAVPAERRQVLAAYQAALTLKGDAVRGREVFRANCTTCHQIEGVGHRVGPDISDTRTKTPAMLLQDILDPNAAIDANYVNYAVTTRSGKVATGLIAADTASSLTLLRGDGQTETILRQDIEEVRSSGLSLMPEGLEKQLTVAQMADLLAYLKNWRYLDGKVPTGPSPP